MYRHNSNNQQQPKEDKKLSEHLISRNDGSVSVNRVGLIRDHLLLMSSAKIWVADPNAGFIPGEISDLGSNNTLTVFVTDGRTKKKREVVVGYDEVFPAEDDNECDYEDNCSLMYLNEATLLENVRRRFGQGKIYSFIANMLIAVNPYVGIRGLYDDEAIKRYQGKSLGVLPPHVYAIGDKSLRDMFTTRQSQSIIVSGESGAGKTESTKYILRYLCKGSGSNDRIGEIERRILDANPILESFGNAKTTRNNNSSRFGKFIEIHFDGGRGVAGGFISHYLLEKARITSQSPTERNYHIFYQLLSSHPSLQSLGLNPDPNHYNYLNSGLCAFFDNKQLKDPIVHDANCFQTLEKSFKSLGIGEINEIYKTVAVVLLMGNIEFVDEEVQGSSSKGGCKVVENESLTKLLQLMQLEKSEFISALTSRVMQTAKGGSKGTVIQVPLKKYEAKAARDALGKSIYKRLFDYLVGRINEAIPFSDSVTYIGVLDIAGFEYFTVNSFEQFCINFCNEKLQQFFNERVLKDEQELYAREQLNVKKIPYVDNADCIDLIEGKVGILSILDEESKLPKPNAQHFTSEVHRQLNSHFRLQLPRKSKIKEHREILDEEGFIVRHFAGSVCYDTKSFVEKNNDALHFSLELLMKESGCGFLRNLFVSVEGLVSGKLGRGSVAGGFRIQLGGLLEKLRSTGTSFIRCIKPNDKMVEGVFEGGLILSQLQCAGMSAVLELMQGGFPSRVNFTTLYKTYSTLLPPKLSSLDPRFFCRALFKALGLSEEDFRFGLTRVFFRPGKFKEFDQLMRNDPENLKILIEKVGRWIILSKWKRGMFGVWSAIKLKNKILYRRSALITMQKTVKMHLAKSKHRPRYIAIRQLNKSLDSVKQLESTANKLKDQSALNDVKNLIGEIGALIGSVKNNANLPKKELELLPKKVLEKTSNLAKKLQLKVEEEKNAEEKAKAKALQLKIEEEKRKEAERENAQREEEINRKKKQQLETNRLAEEQRLQSIEKLSKQNLQKIPVENNAESLSQQLEKRDNEMAFRLSNIEGSSVVEQQEAPLKRSNYIVTSKAGKKYDLSTWKYSELRDSINTSCDVELLSACREEFHRRLKVYHAWKARNSSASSSNNASKEATPKEDSSSSRAPKSIYQYQQSNSNSSAIKIDPNQNRYFRIPFVKEGMNKGLWYAHFVGEFIQRQMEVGGGDSSAVLLVAGRDDMQMCELKLSETGLTRKRGAEILEYDFEKEWARLSAK